MTNVVVLAGPTAVGKGTLVRALRERNPQVWFSISATTREPRPGEVDGIDYFFVSDAEFDRMVKHEELLEWAVVHKVHRYGTPRGPVDEHLGAGVPVIIEIDLQGARQLRNSIPEARFVFVMPPTWEELQRRLEERGTEDAKERERRLATARNELAAADEFEIHIENDDLDTAVEQLERVVFGSR